MPNSPTVLDGGGAAALDPLPFHVFASPTMRRSELLLGFVTRTAGVRSFFAGWWEREKREGMAGRRVRRRVGRMNKSWAVCRDREGRQLGGYTPVVTRAAVVQEGSLIAAAV